MTEYEQHSNKIATRVYLVAFAMILISITIGLLLIVEANTKIIIYPNQEEFDGLPHDAQCPCTQLSIPYGSFLNVQVRFHQVCSSDLISNRWINAIFENLYHNRSYYVADFRSIGSGHFQVLRSLCQLSNRYFNDSLQSLYSRSFVSSKALDRNTLQSTIDGYMEDFQLNIPLIFKSRIELIKQFTFSNQLIPALDSTIYIVLRKLKTEGVNYTQLSTSIRSTANGDGSFCACVYSYDCREQSGIFYLNTSSIQSVGSDQLLLPMKNFYAGCTSLNALLQSTLEYFYNQTLLNQLLNYFPANHQNFPALSISNNTQFSMNSTIQSIINKLMLEELSYNISHQNFYAQCKPYICTYIKVERHQFYYILTTIIGLLGGLTLTLQILIPSIVHYIRNRYLKKQKSNNKNNSISFRQIIIRFKSYSIQQIMEYNLFTNQQKNEYNLRCQRNISRLYILLLILSFFIVLIYLIATKPISNETMHNPEQFEYNHLKELYSNNLQCSCNEFSQSYQNFISIEPVYHLICSSDFLSTDWMNLMSFFTHQVIINNLQYTINFVSQFNILKTLCDSAQDIIDDARRIFLQTKYVSPQLIDENYFLDEIFSLIQHWKTNTKYRYERIVQLIREINQGNKLLSYEQNTNFVFNQTTTELYYKSLNYSNCSCDLYGSCSTSIHYTPPDGFGSFAIGVPFEIPNFLIGCFPVESLLQSTLQCFSNQTCLDSVLQGISANIVDNQISMNFSVLNISKAKQDATVESILQELMVDSWIENISYASYYNTCRPTCTYEIVKHRNFLIILTTIISVFDGLATILEIGMLIIVRLIEELPNMQSLKYIFTLIKQKSPNKLKIMLFFLLTTIFYLISFLTPQVKIISNVQPTIEFHENLQCFCSKSLNTYKTFVDIQAQIHSICLSDFISNDWIEYISYETDQLGYYQLLVSFCQLATNIINNTLEQFAQTNYVSTQLIPSNLFNKTIQNQFEQFQKEYINEFLNMLDIIRQLTGSNMLLNKYSTNWKYNVVPADFGSYGYYLSSIKYEDCDCGTSSTCTQVLSDKRIVGCYPLESFLQGTLQCFYHQNCIDPLGNYQHLNATSNETIQILLENLFVEQYLFEISYEKYFNACSATHCTYSYNGYGNPIDIVLLLIGLYGGLTILSDWITLAILKLYQMTFLSLQIK